MSKTFKYAGVAAFNGSYKVRFSDRNVYAADWVHAVELTAPMSKESAIELLLETDFVKNDEQVLAVVKETFDRRSTKAARDAEREAAKAMGLTLKRGRKPKAKTPVAEAAPAVEPVVTEPSAVTAADADLEAAPF